MRKRGDVTSSVRARALRTSASTSVVPCGAPRRGPYGAVHPSHRMNKVVGKFKLLPEEVVHGHHRGRIHCDDF